MEHKPAIRPEDGQAVDDPATVVVMIAGRRIRLPRLWPQEREGRAALLIAAGLFIITLWAIAALGVRVL